MREKKKRTFSCRKSPLRSSKATKSRACVGGGRTQRYSFSTRTLGGVSRGKREGEKRRRRDKTPDASFSYHSVDSKGRPGCAEGGRRGRRDDRKSGQSAAVSGGHRSERQRQM